MKPSGILKWAQNTKNSNGKNKDKGKRPSTFYLQMGIGQTFLDFILGKSWVHSPDTLLKGHVAYLVKVSYFTFKQYFQGIIFHY